MESERSDLIPPVGATRIADDLDRISLEQALRDFDLANARVLDLTGRLTTMNSQLVEARAKNSMLRAKIRNLQRAAVTTRTAPAVRGLRPIARRSVRTLRRVKAELRK